jgi:hypothetical protein
MATLGCGEHQAFIVARGGQTILYELDRLEYVDWERQRDDISQAYVRVGAGAECCGQLGGLTSGYHELHIYRSGQKVWEGPVIRPEYAADSVTIYANDILWVAKNTVLEKAYNKAYPNIAKCGWVMNWLLRDQTFLKYGDPWNAASRVRWVQGSDDPSTSSAVKAWSMTTWEDFDKYAEDKGMDYTVAGRDIYFWDTHLKWRTLSAPLVADYLTDGMEVVEYGNEFATRVIVTNGNGYASQAVAPAWAISQYGYIDHLISTYNEAAGTEVPDAEDKRAWQEQAQSTLDASFPAPVRVRVPDNSTLVPSAPYGINELVAGAWVQVVSNDLCRTLDQWHKLDRVHVRQEGGEEKVEITTTAAPERIVEL